MHGVFLKISFNKTLAFKIMSLNTELLDKSELDITTGNDYITSWTVNAGNHSISLTVLQYITGCD